MLTKPIWPFVIFIMIIILLGQTLYLKTESRNFALLNKPVPQFNLESLTQNTPFITQEIFKGHTTVLNVWASWCSACAEEHLFLNGLNKTGEFQLVGIDYKDQKNSADLWLNKLGNPYTVIIFDENGSLSIDLGVYGTPTAYIIDRDGIIRYRHVGVLTKELWNRIIIPEINKLKTI